MLWLHFSKSGASQSGCRRAGEERVRARLFDDEHAVPPRGEALRAGERQTVGFADRQTVAQHRELELRRRQREIEARNDSRYRRVPIVLRRREYRHRPAQLGPGAPARARTSPSSPVPMRRVKAAKAPPVGCGHVKLAGGFPLSCSHAVVGLVFVAEEATQDQPGEIRLRGGAVRRVADVGGEMLRNDVRAMRKFHERATEIVPALVLVRFLDERLFRGGEAGEQKRKPRQLGPRLEVQLLHRLALGIRQLLDRIELEDHVLVAQRQGCDQLLRGRVVLERPGCGKFHMLGDRDRERGAVLACLRTDGKPCAGEGFREEVLAQIRAADRCRPGAHTEVGPHRGGEAGPGRGRRLPLPSRGPPAACAASCHRS